MPVVRRTLLLPLFLFVFSACQPPSDDAQRIVDRAIEVHGGDHLHRSVVEFDFRGQHFKATRDGGLFRYERTFTDSTGRIRDVLTNDSLYREVDGERVALDERELGRVRTAVNSVVYFALLPYNLNDPAVQKRYLGETEIAGEPYHEIEVTFRRENGGPDYEDRYVYWIHRDRSTMDYLAYTFDGDGTRFRQAFDERTVGGVRFANYVNYTSDSLGTDIERFDELVATEALERVSDIVIENVEVRPLASP